MIRIIQFLSIQSLIEYEKITLHRHIILRWGLLGGSLNLFLLFSIRTVIGGFSNDLIINFDSKKQLNMISIIKQNKIIDELPRSQS